jgi:Family of unknown function (DUF6064)
VLAYGLALALLWLAFPHDGDGAPRPIGSRLPAMILAAAWAWTGAVFHGRYFAAINFMAPVYAGLFLLQALLLVWSGVFRGRIAPHRPAGLAGWAGVALLAYAIAGYPAIAAIAGDGVANVPVVGFAPGATAVLTLGMLVLADGRTPLHLAFVPVLWSLIAGATAWTLGVPEDLVLPLLGLGSLALIVWKNRRRAA